MTRLQVDLNCDVGESFGRYAIGDDEGVLPHVTSANVACGFHAGDPVIMRRTVRLAVRLGVAVGAHPGFPDLGGFGRRELQAAPDEIEAMVLYQVSALAGIAAAEGGRLRHVKPHGALYNMAARDRRLADAVARGVAAAGRELILVGLSGSHLLDAGRAAGLDVASEAFADRAYEATGALRSRSQPDSVIGDPAEAVERVLRMLREGAVTAVNGEAVAVRADTICIHGDTPGAAPLAAAVRAGLEAAGVAAVPPGA
ncbi:MAG: LamB/YcsF family protein [Acidobacteria bacterium]|nr:LamB/YcsF family protein [Acidobacteriota bacterium]